MKEAASKHEAEIKKLKKRLRDSEQTVAKLADELTDCRLRSVVCVVCFFLSLLRSHFRLSHWCRCHELEALGGAHLLEDVSARDTLFQQRTVPRGRPSPEDAALLDKVEQLRKRQEDYLATQQQQHRG